jgi:TetR/AcrR family transcriptional repressor of nem operon
MARSGSAGKIMTTQPVDSGTTSGTQAPVRLAPIGGGMIEKLLDAAQALIQQKGYNGFSYDDVSRMVGLKKPSIHHYFPRKEDLGASVAQRYADRVEARLADIDASGDDAARRLTAYLHMFFETYGPLRRICPCGILGAEMDALPPPVAQAAHRFFRANLAWLTALLADGRQTGTLAYEGPTADMAMLLLSTLEGAMIVGRGLGDTDTLNQVGATILRNLRVTSTPA